MRHRPALADRLCDPALRLIALVNTAFFIAFIAALMAATSNVARAQGAACTGTDLLAQMQEEDPQQLARLRAEAAATTNSDALLWRIEAQGTAPSFLFGTMHMADPRVVALPAPAQNAFDEAATVVIETTDILDPAGMMAAIMSDPELTMFTDATTLTSLLGEDDRRIVEEGLAARNIPPASVQKMKPWMLSAMVALPACEFARKTAGEEVLDQRLATDALAAGKKVAGLERAVDQLSAMASLPLDFHLDGLVEVMRLGERIDDVMETMIAIYLSGETGLFWPFFNAVVPGQGSDAPGFADFEEALINARNRTMAQNAVAFIEEGNAFIAVGALHLPGEEGLVGLLRAQGYSVTPVR
jgi:uncharacterized protein